MLVVAIIGVLAALAIPSFMRFQARSKQSEVKGVLRAIGVAENSYLSEKNDYSAFFSDIGFEPERGNRYAYFIGGTSLEPRTASAIPTGKYDGIEADVLKFVGQDSTIAQYKAGGNDPNGGVPGIYNSGKAYMAVAVGNIDDDTSRDSWFVSSEVVVETSGTCGNSDTVAPAGAPFNVYNDVGCK